MTALEITITLGVDGRLYLQDVPPELLPIVRALCADDPALESRSLATDSARETNDAHETRSSPRSDAGDHRPAR